MLTRRLLAVILAAAVSLEAPSQVQRGTGLQGVWTAVDQQSSTALTLRPDATYEHASSHPGAGVTIFESGVYQVEGGALDLRPSRRHYTQGGAKQVEAGVPQRYDWQLLYDSATRRRVLVLTTSNSRIELREDGPGAVGAGDAGQLPNLRDATICETPRMTCPVVPAGVHRKGALCSCSHPVTGLALDYGRAR